MPKYVITTPGGVKYEVESPDFESANADLKAHRQEEANQNLIAEANAMPEWAKPFAAMRDVGTVGADTLTAGFGTKAVKGLFGGEPEIDVAARRNRMGLAAPAADVALMAGALPTAVPRAIKYMGGGPIARGLTGTTAAGIEGATVGGLEAAGHDQPVEAGAAIGGLGGAIGQQVAPITNKVAKWWSGIDDSIPQGIRSKILKVDKPSPTDKVTMVDTRADLAAAGSDNPLARQEALKRGAKDLYLNEPKTYTKEQRAAIEAIFNEAPMTGLSRRVGDVLSNKMVASGAGAAGGVGGFVGGGPPGAIMGALATTSGLLGAGKALKAISTQGTDEAMSDLRRLMANKKKYQGLLTPEKAAEITKGLRQLGLEGEEYDLY